MPPLGILDCLRSVESGCSWSFHICCAASLGILLAGSSSAQAGNATIDFAWLALLRLLS